MLQMGPMQKLPWDYAADALVAASTESGHVELSFHHGSHSTCLKEPLTVSSFES